MTLKTDNVTRLTALVTPADYQAANPHLFPSANALAWFIRRHAKTLIKRRALLKINGRKVISPAQFDAAVIEVGHADMLSDQRGGARRSAS